MKRASCLLIAATLGYASAGMRPIQTKATSPAADVATVQALRALEEKATLVTSLRTTMTAGSQKKS